MLRVDRILTLVSMLRIRRAMREQGLAVGRLLAAARCDWRKEHEAGIDLVLKLADSTGISRNSRNRDEDDCLLDLSLCQDFVERCEAQILDSIKATGIVETIAKDFMGKLQLAYPSTPALENPTG